MSNATHDPKHHDHKPVYVKVWLALLVLTAITVTVAYQDYGTWNIFVAMFVATIKASLVMLFFMHLKYDNKFNQVVFGSSFVFLAVFVALTASDLFDRGVEQPAIAAAAPTGGGASADELQTLRQSTPELVAKGKDLYTARCSSCHGEQGRGDGPAAAAFNPPPRNFTKPDGWKLERTVSGVLTAVTKGLTGTPMPAFESTLPLAERFAIVHYVRSLMPDAPADTDAGFTAMQEALGLSGGGSAAQVRLPIDLVLPLMAEAPAVVASAATPNAAPSDHPGAALYAQHCATCHGPQGQGGVKVQVLGVNPRAYLDTAPLGHGPWRTDEARFTELVAHGQPGRGKPGISHFTQAEWRALHAYTRELSR